MYFTLRNTNFYKLHKAQRTITYLVIKISTEHYSLFLSLDYKSTETKYRTRFHARERMRNPKISSPKFERVYQRAHVRPRFPKTFSRVAKWCIIPQLCKPDSKLTRKLATDTIATHPPRQKEEAIHGGHQLDFIQFIRSRAASVF